MLEKIFNKRTIQLIDLISKEPAHIRYIAEKLGASPGYIDSIIKFLRKNDLVKEKKVKNRKIISLNPNSIFLRNIRSLINIEKISKNVDFKRLLKIGEVGTYGSYANGTDDSLSDIDIWIYTKRKMLYVQDITTKLEKSIGKKVNFIILNKDKLKDLEKNDYEFYIRLKLTSIVFGEDIFDKN